MPKNPSYPRWERYPFLWLKVPCKQLIINTSTEKQNHKKDIADSGNMEAKNAQAIRLKKEKRMF